MANHRMFSNRIGNSARFLQMPDSSQLLYFHMILRADDDGVVEAYPITKLLGSTPDTFKVLLAKGFVQQLNEDQVILITEWTEHNKIRADRKVDSVYKHLILKQCPSIELLEAKPRSDVKDNSKRVNGRSMVSVSKDKLSKDKLIDNDYFDIFWNEYPKKVGKYKTKQSFNKLKPNNNLLKVILESIKKFKQTKEWQSDNGQFIPYPATWLNQKRWEDEIEIIKKSKVYNCKVKK